MLRYDSVRVGKYFLNFRNLGEKNRQSRSQVSFSRRSINFFSLKFNLEGWSCRSDEGRGIPWNKRRPEGPA